MQASTVAALYNWRKHHAGLILPEVKLLHQLGSRWETSATNATAGP
jgi:hypothetical protein